MTKIELLEPSIADVLKAIEAATNLTANKKTHWSCSVRQICIGIGRPPESIPGRWSGVNAAMPAASSRSRRLQSEDAVEPQGQFEGLPGLVRRRQERAEAWHGAVADMGDPSGEDS